MSDTASLPAASLLRTPQHSLVLRLRNAAAESPPLRLASAKCTIGSGEGCTLRVRADGVEPLHCLILRGPRQTVVRRWSRHTQLNGRPFADATLKLGDRLGIGPYEFEVLDGIDTALTAIAESAAVARPTILPAASQIESAAQTSSPGATVAPRIAELVQRAKRAAGPSRRRLRKLREQLSAAALRQAQSAVAIAQQASKIQELECQRDRAAESLRGWEQRCEHNATSLASAREEVAALQEQLAAAIAQREELNCEWSAARAAWQAQSAAWQFEREAWEAQGRNWEAERQTREAQSHVWESERQGFTTQRENWELERLKFADQRQAWESDRRQLDAEREVWEAERLRLDAERQAWESDRLRLATDWQTWEADRRELETQQQALADDRAAALAERQTIETEREVVEAERRALAAEGCALVDRESAWRAEQLGEQTKLEQQAVGLRQEAERLAVLVDQLEYDRAEFERECGELLVRETELRAAQAAVESRQAALDQLAAELEDREEALDGQTTAFEQHQSELAGHRARLESQLSECEAREADLCLQRTELTAQREELDRRRHEFDAQADAFRAEYEQVRQKLAREETELSARRKELVDTQTAWVAEHTNGSPAPASNSHSIETEAEQFAAERTALEAREQSLTEAEQVVAGERRQLASQECELNSRRETIAAEQAALEAARGQLSATEQELAAQRQAADQQLDELAAKLRAAEAHHEAAEANRQALEVELIERNTEAGHAAARLAEQTAALNGTIAEFNARQTAWEAEQSQLEQKLTAGVQHCEERGAELDRLRADVESQHALWQAERKRIEAELAVQRSELESRAAAVDAEPPAADNAAERHLADRLEAMVHPRVPAAGRREPTFADRASMADEALPVNEGSDETASAAAGPASSDEEAIFSRLRALSLIKDELSPDAPVGNAELSSPAKPERDVVADQESVERAPDLPPADEELAPSPHRPQPTEASPEEEEESIESYMVRLLSRVGGHSSQPASGATTAPAAPRPIQSRLAELQPVTVAPPPSAKNDEASVSPRAASQPPAQPLDANQWIARSAAPEKNANLAAMRELANITARVAIDKHARGRWSRVGLWRLAAGLAMLVTGIAMVCGNAAKIPALVMLGPSFANGLHLTGVAVCIAGLFWLSKAANMTRQMKRASLRAKQFFSGATPQGKTEGSAPAQND